MKPSIISSFAAGLLLAAAISSVAYYVTKGDLQQLLQRRKQTQKRLKQHRLLKRWKNFSLPQAMLYKQKKKLKRKKLNGRKKSMLLKKKQVKIQRAMVM